MSWDILPKSNLQYFLQKLKEKFDLKADKEEVEEIDISNYTPFLYRQTPYNADGVFLDELVGGSVAWNQLIQNGDFAATSGWDTSYGITFSVANNVGTITNPDSSDKYVYQNLPMIIGHKCLLTVTGYSNNEHVNDRDGGFELYIGPAGNFVKAVTFTTIKTTYFIIAEVLSNQYNFLRLYSSNGNTSYYSNIKFIDLTQMFGSTIADYVYSLEQATVGSGIAWLKSHGFFTKDYYPYNTGELISVKTSGKRYVGFNQWDEEWEVGGISTVDGTITDDTNKIRSSFIPCFPNTSYYLKTENPASFVWFYDKNKDFISFTTDSVNQTFLTPSDCGFMRLRIGNSETTQTTYNHDICINISKTEGTPKNGDYVPYEEHSYDISNIDLRGIPKLVNNELVYDGDTYESNGDVTRKYGVVDLGNASWNYNSTYQLFTLSLSDCITGVQNILPALLISTGKYKLRGSTGFGGFNDKEYSLISATTALGIKDTDYSDATAFKNSLSGVYLVYELATPTTETADPYTNPQICDKDGTEEFIDDRTVPIPVGHNSRYADLPAIMDGDYLSYMAKNFASEEYVDTGLDTKVDKETGKGLSTNDYTNEEKALVATIPDKADVSEVEGTQSVNGNPINLTDASETYAQSLVVEFSPKQDLHGQSAPYVGGAGKNKLPMTVDSIKDANSNRTWSGNSCTINGVTFTILTDKDGNVTGISASGTNSGNFSTTYLDFYEFGASLNGQTVVCSGNSTDGGKLRVVGYGGLSFTRTGSSATVTVPSDATSAFMRVCVESGELSSGAKIYPMICSATAQNPTVFEPYSNICPITGYTECEVDDVGKNLFDKSNVKNGALDSSGNVYLSPSDTRRVSDYIEIEPNTVYYLSNAIDLANGRTGFWYDENKAAISQITFPSTVQKSGAITSPNNAKYAIICVPSETLDIAQLELGSTPTTYEPYHSSNATIQFGQTVYGGSVDFLTGVLTVDHVKETKTAISGSKPNYYCTARQSADRTKQLDIICDKMNTASSVGAEGVYVNSNGALMLKTSMYESATDLLNAMGGEFDVCFAIANPFEIQLTPQELKLLKHYNNLTTNGTTINLWYQPDNVIGEAIKASEEYTDRVVESIGSDVVANISEIVTYSGETISLKAVKFKNGVKFLYISCFGFPKVSSVIGINGFLTSEFYPSNPINVDADLVAFDNSNNPFRVTIGKTNGTIYIYGAPDDGIELRGIYM